MNLKPRLLGISYPLCATLAAGTLGAQATWQPLPDSPSPRIEAPLTVATIDGSTKLFAIGGQIGSELLTDTLNVLDVETNTWTECTIAPEIARDHWRAAVVESETGPKIWLLGGKYNVFQNISDRVDIYDPVTGEFTQGPDLPDENAGATVVAIGTKIYLIGGAISKTVNTPNAYVLDTADEEPSWEPHGVFYDAMGFVHGGGAVLDGAIFGVGGGDRHTLWGQSDLTHAYRYDPVEGQFFGLEPLPVATSHVDFSTLAVPADLVPEYAASVGNVDGFILVGAPAVVDAPTVLPSDRILAYDVTNGTWQELAVGLPAPMVAPGWALVGDSIYSVAGGYFSFSPFGFAWRVKVKDLFFSGRVVRPLHTYAPLDARTCTLGGCDNLWSPNDVYPLFGAEMTANGMRFDGEDDRAFVPGMDVSFDGTETDRFTLAVMFRPDTVEQEGRLFAKASSSSAQDTVFEMGLFPTPAGTHLRCRVRTNGTTKTFLGDNALVQPEQWQGAVMIYDGSTLQLLLANGDAETLEIAGEWDLEGTVELDPDVYFTLGNTPDGARGFEGRLLHFLHLPGLPLPLNTLVKYFELYTEAPLGDPMEEPDDELPMPDEMPTETPCSNDDMGGDGTGESESDEGEAPSE